MEAAAGPRWQPFFTALLSERPAVGEVGAPVGSGILGWPGPPKMEVEGEHLKTVSSRRDVALTLGPAVAIFRARRDALPRAPGPR